MKESFMDRIKKNICIAMVLALLCVTGVLWAAQQKFPVPPGATLVAVEDQLNYEGITLQVRKFDIEMSMEEVLNFYRQTWQGEFVENDIPPWKMISTKQGDRFYTVQIQPTGPGACWGYLGVSDLPKVLEQGKTLGGNKRFFPMMNGSQIVNDMDHHDIGKKGRTLLITNHFSVTSNAEYYRGFYTDKGWSKVVDVSGEPGKNHVLMFQQGSQQVSLTIDKVEQKTNIIVNDVKN
jgi:hypothetical protein